MSKVGESVIQGAIEALELAQQNDSKAEGGTSESTDLSEALQSVTKIAEKTEIE